VERKAACIDDVEGGSEEDKSTAEPLDALFENTFLFFTFTLRS
jgi:hypothetical protein